MNELKKFMNSEFGEIRAVEKEGEPWFVGKDVAETLGYRDTSDALKRHVDDEDKLTRCFTDSGQNREMYIINESGLYSLILSSKLPNAKKFKHWITSEVIPAIRKTGGYISGQETMSDTELMAKALMVAQKTIEQRNALIDKQTAQIEEMQPKAVFADAVAASKSSILVGELAKLLSQNGVPIGQNRLFEKLRNDGYLIKTGSSKNMPTQKSMEMGLFEIKESTHIDGNGNSIITKTPKVTGRGQAYFVNRLLGEHQKLGCQNIE